MNHKNFHLTFQKVLRRVLYSLSILIFLTGPYRIQAQSRSSLEQSRMEIIQNIEKTSAILSQTREKRQSALDQAKILELQISNRTALVKTTKEQILAVSNEIQHTQHRIQQVEQDLSETRNNYNQLLRQAYLLKKTSNKKIFLFSSTNLNKFFTRWRYLLKWKNSCLQQLDLYSSNAIILKKIAKQLEKDKQEHFALLDHEKEYQSALEADLQKKDNLVQNLLKDEKNFTKTLSTQKQERENLNRAIENVIIASLSSDNKMTLSFDEGNNEKHGLNPAGFGANMHQLPWPVSGEIYLKFGKQKHPIVKDVEIINKGIDIQANAGAKVNAVYDGQVVSASLVAGQGNMLILNHGAFYTVYSKLDQIYVTKGQKVHTGERLGQTFGYDNSQSGILHFEIWEGRKQLNPENWLRDYE